MYLFLLNKMIYNLGPVGAHQVIKSNVLTIFIINNLIYIMLKHILPHNQISKNINMFYAMLGPFRAHQVMHQK